MLGVIMHDGVGGISSSLGLRVNLVTRPDREEARTGMEEASHLRHHGQDRANHNEEDTEKHEHPRRWDLAAGFQCYKAEGLEELTLAVGLAARLG